MFLRILNIKTLNNFLIQRAIIKSYYLILIPIKYLYYILNIYKIKVYIYNFYIKVALNCPIVLVNITNNVNDIKNHIILNTLLFSDFIPMNAYADKATIGSLVKDQVLFVVKGISTVNME